MRRKFLGKRVCRDVGADQKCEKEKGSGRVTLKRRRGDTKKGGNGIPLKGIAFRNTGLSSFVFRLHTWGFCSDSSHPN